MRARKVTMNRATTLALILLALSTCTRATYATTALLKVVPEYCCTALSLALGSKVSYPGHGVYVSSLRSYFSAQEAQLSPSCVVSPTSNKDVATAVKALAVVNALSKSRCKFAIRGGGHTPWAGSANIDRGVTIDLRGMHHVSVNADQAIISVGSGAIWGDVYTYLDAMNLSVSGGRVSEVGVGGLTTGGGLSFFSPRYGFVCDNVVNYEIVLASGKIVNANEHENPDLWIALKGGNNNFGVITRFDLRTFPQGKFWGGVIYYPISTASEQIKAFSNFGSANGYDPYAALIQSFGFNSAQGFGIANSIEYTKPVVNPPAFEPFTSMQPQYASTMRISNLSDFTGEQSAFSPNGHRQFYVTTTFKNDAPFLQEVFNIFNASLQPIAGVAGLVYSLTFQPIPPAITNKSAPLGGNSLGLDPSDGALVLCLLSTSWSLPADDNRVTDAGKDLFAQIDVKSQAAGLFNRFKYLNYAASFQDPISGYGPTSKAKLQAASRKYDPQGIFQTSVPGGYKLFTD